jgi:hypothetical protein
MLTINELTVSILIVVDEHTQECLRILAAYQITVQDVMDELFSLFLRRGIPTHLFAFIDSDAMPNGIDEWLEKLEPGCTFVEMKRYDENLCAVLFKDELVKNILRKKNFDSLTEMQLWLADWRDKHNRSINLLGIWEH